MLGGPGHHFRATTVAIKPRAGPGTVGAPYGNLPDAEAPSEKQIGREAVIRNSASGSWHDTAGLTGWSESVSWAAIPWETYPD
jgi:hypothetical protein